MSLFVVLKSKNARGDQNYIERHIPFHQGTLPALANEDIDHIQADGDELEYIVSTFQNIPICSRRVVKWVGETAHFIYQNLR